MKKKDTTVPLISVMMCAYNAASYIGEAIDSVLQQTYKDFEFIIVDDESTDKTLDVIRSYNDPRIRVIACPHDYIKSLNMGMKACRGTYIARMDADDKMVPERLEKQLQMMQKHPDIAICFSWLSSFGIGERLFCCEAKEWVEHAFFGLLTGNYLAHPTAMFRKSFFKEHRLRYKPYPYAEDYKLWTEVSRLDGRFYVIPEPLVLYRIAPSQVSNKHREEQKESRLLIQQEIIEELLRRIKHPQKKALSKLYRQTLLLNQAGLVQGNEIVVLMYKLFRRTDLFNY